MDPLSVPPSPARQRRALARACMDAFPRMGVYALRHLGSGRIFVVAGTRLDAAMQRQRFELRLGQHRNRALQEDWTRDGEAAFAFETLALVQQHEDTQHDYLAEVQALHGLWCEELQPYDVRGYNSRTRREAIR